ncbi:MAG: SIMPL domain-containing protein [Caldimonas sp.]
MKSLSHLFVGVVVLATAGSLVRPAVAQPVAPQQGVLGIAATASVEVTRDLLSITFSTSRDGSDAGAVQSQLKQALDAALAEAKKAARPGQVDVQTGNFSLYPRYSSGGVSGKQSLSGWQGSAELVVEGRDMAAIGVLAGRITTMTIARVAYRLSREATHRVEAEIAADAIGRFRAKAAEYAKQFGYGGYNVREVNVATGDSGQGPVPMRMSAPMSMSKSSSEALTVEPGKETVTATVSGTIQMK